MTRSLVSDTLPKIPVHRLYSSDVSDGQLTFINQKSSSRGQTFSVPQLVQGKDLNPGYTVSRIVDSKYPTSHSVSFAPNSLGKESNEYDRIHGKMAPKKLYQIIDGINNIEINLGERKSVYQKKLMLKG